VAARVLNDELFGTIDALRLATRSHHAALAAQPAMAKLFDPDYTIQEYRAHLARLLGLFEPLERAVADIAGQHDRVRLHQRSNDLRDDVLAMGATAADVASIERCAEIPAIDPAGLQGYSYVILGSMLGGKLVVKQLRERLGPGASFRFYGDAGGRVEALWDAYCLGLQRDRGADVSAICSTAVSIFDLYARWMSGAATRARAG